MHSQRSRALRYASLTDAPIPPDVLPRGRISQGPPGNIVASGYLPPLRRVLERSAQMLPAGSSFSSFRTGCDDTDVAEASSVCISPRSICSQE